MNKLLDKIEKKGAKVIVIGLGYVGLPLACEIARAGFNVIGIDKDNSKVKAINRGKNYISDMVDSELSNIIGTEKLIATQDFKKVKEVDVIILSVPTPLTKNQEPDMRFINKALDKMLPFIHKKQLIILESTTYPGTTEELIRPQLESRGFEIGQDLYLAFSLQAHQTNRQDISKSPNLHRFHLYHLLLDFFHWNISSSQNLTFQSRQLAGCNFQAASLMSLRCKAQLLLSLLIY